MGPGSGAEPAPARRPLLGARFRDALAYAALVHYDQRRKADGPPYVSHLLAVCATVIEAGGTEDDAITALLHDALEDQPGRTSPADLASLFGPAVAEAVVLCSDTVGHADPAHKPPWIERKRAYLAHLEDAPPGVLLVGLADKLHNLRSLHRDVQVHGLAAFDRFNAGPDGQRWYHEQCLAVFQRRRPGPLTDEYAAEVERLRRLTDGYGGG